MAYIYKKNLKLVGNVLAVASIVAISIKIFRMGESVFASLDWKSCIFTMTLSLLIYTAVFSFAALAWKLMLEYFTGQQTKFCESYYIYNKANLGKYLPGNVIQYVERNVFMSQKGAGQIEVLACSVLEILEFVFSAVVLSFCLAWQTSSHFVQEQLSDNCFLLFVISSVIIIGVGVFFILCKRVQKIQAVVNLIVNKKFMPVGMACVALYMLLLFVHGLTLMICLKSFPVNLSFSETQLLFSANTLSWLAGFIVIGAPGGVGVREFVLSRLTAGIQYSDYIIAAAVIHRLVLVAADILSYLLGVLFLRTVRREAETRR